MQQSTSSSVKVCEEEEEETFALMLVYMTDAYNPVP